MEDKHLNSFVGPKRPDPYRDDTTYKVNPYKLKSIKEKVDFSKLNPKKLGSQDNSRLKSNFKEKAMKPEKTKPVPSNMEAAQISGIDAERLATYSKETLQTKVMEKSTASRNSVAAFINLENMESIAFRCIPM